MRPDGELLSDNMQFDDFRDAHHRPANPKVRNAIRASAPAFRGRIVPPAAMLGRIVASGGLCRWRRYPPASGGASPPPAIRRIDTSAASPVLRWLQDEPNKHRP
jgi:hypothetical protein